MTAQRRRAGFQGRRVPPTYTHDFETGTTSQWFSNETGGGASVAAMIDGHSTPADVRQGRYSASMTLANPQTRCELVMSSGSATVPALFSEGERWQFSWSFKLSAAWNNSNASFQLIAQWFPYPSQNFSGSPPVSILAGSYLYGSAADLQLTGSAGQPTRTDQYSVSLGTLAAIRGSWVDMVVTITFSTVAASSRITVVMNSVTLVNNLTPTLPTLAGSGPLGTADRCYFKIGNYRDSAVASTDTIIVDNVEARQVFA